MEWIAVQHYYKVKREISNGEQKSVVDERSLYLSKEGIVTKYRQFLIADVHDISYKAFGEDGGLLYLHTFQGVFTYMVYSDPISFIEAYKGLTDKLSKEK